MGEIIRFPDEKRLSWSGTSRHAGAESASIVILPVIRIERQLAHVDPALSPELDSPGGRRRRRPARRS
ncbi:MAG: hypothetical protein QOD74_1875 [Variibacter sp.]|jgi:hypothetical protein|nr:hypothetical protein [Variibacter sp.]